MISISLPTVQADALSVARNGFACAGAGSKIVCGGGQLYEARILFFLLLFHLSSHLFPFVIFFKLPGCPGTVRPDLSKRPSGHLRCRS